MSNQPIVVLGATGNVGSALTRTVVNSGETVRGIYSPDNGESLAEIERFPGSFDDTRLLESAFSGARSVFMLTPPSPSQPAWHRSIVGAAIATGIQRIVKLSAFDSGPKSRLAMGRWHADGEACLAESGLEHVILRPQYFQQMMPAMLKAGAATGVMRGAAAGSLRMGFVDVRDIAAVAAIALTGELSARRILVPTGPDAPSYDEIAEMTSQATGRSVYYEQRTEKDVREDFLARGWPEWHIDDYIAIHGLASSDLVTSDVRDVTGHEPRSIVDLIDELRPGWG